MPLPSSGHAAGHLHRLRRPLAVTAALLTLATTPATGQETEKNAPARDGVVLLPNAARPLPLPPVPTPDEEWPMGAFWTEDLPWFPGGNVVDFPSWPGDFGASAAEGSFALCSSDPGLPFELESVGLIGMDLGGGIFVVNSLDPAVLSAFSDPKWLSLWLPGACQAEPDWFARSPEGSQANAIIVGSEFGRSFEGQKALLQIRAPQAHQKATGRGVVVAILDTGVDSGHPFLRDRLLPGRDFVDLDDHPLEDPALADSDLDGERDPAFGHGTVIAGLVLAVAPDARVLPVRVLDSHGIGTASRVAAAIRWAVDQGADVINMSLGMRGRSALVETAVREAADAGVVIVAAAGNGGRRAADFPARFPDVVSVAALGLRGRRARFSNDRRTGVRAPGRDLIGPFPGGTWARASGTSFAAPLVSAAAALALEGHSHRSPEQVRERLERGARLKLPRVVR